MSDTGFAARHALLKAELEALRLERGPREEIEGVAREVLDLSLGHERASEARAALGDYAAVLPRDDPGNVMLLHYYGTRVALLEGDAKAAVGEGERAVALARENDLDSDLPHVLSELAEGLEALERKAEARRAREEAAAAFEATDQPARAGIEHRKLARGAPPDEALAAFRSAVRLAERGDEPRLTAAMLFSLGTWHAERDEYLPARHALERSLKLAREQQDPEGEAYGLEQLAWLEVEAFHHEDALRMATEALEAAQDDWQRGRALDARANARHRLHDHLNARADLLEAARAFEAAGEPEWTKDCLGRADGDRLLHYLHYLPSWVYRHKDMSTRQSAMKRPFQPFLLWLIALLFTWVVGLSALAAYQDLRVMRRAILLIAMAPLIAFPIVSTWVLGKQLIAHFKAKRATREGQG